MVNTLTESDATRKVWTRTLEHVFSIFVVVIVFFILLADTRFSMDVHIEAYIKIIPEAETETAIMCMTTCFLMTADVRVEKCSTLLM